RNVLFFHEQAFADTGATLEAIRQALLPTELVPIMVPAARVSLTSAVATYLFNSQLLSRADGRMILVVPIECRADQPVAEYLQDLLASGGPIAEVAAFELRQSMQNGGGPACLRLRVVLDDSAHAAVLPTVWINDRLHAQLASW